MDKKVAKEIKRRYSESGRKLGPIMHPKGKYKVIQVGRGGLTCDDRKLTGFSKIKNTGPICKRCDIAMEKFHGKYFCKICYASVNAGKWANETPKRKKSKKYHSLKTNNDLLERNKQKYAKHGYTGR